VVHSFIDTTFRENGDEIPQLAMISSQEAIDKNDEVVRRVTRDLDRLSFNTAISHLMVFSIIFFFFC